MALTDISHPTDIAMLTDLYELTMAQGLWESGKANEQGCFTAFYRDHPFGSAYAVMCGTAELPELVENLRFTPEDIDYLASLQAPAGGAMFKPAFLDYLRDFRAHVNIDAVPEGELVFPREPMVRVTGPALECQLLETALLNIVGFQTLVATKTARVVLAADGRPVAEFGLRRAQGPDGGLAVARASYVAGCSSTSNVLAGRRYGIPVFGTHAHSWVMSFPTELDAFRAYADIFPDSCMLLVDTYDTLRSGVPNAIKVFNELKAKGHKPVGIRMDSGDLAYLSKRARTMLDDAGFAEAKICASGDLDETVIRDLKAQGARIDLWGVGTKLITSMDFPALGGVYKMAAEIVDGKLVPKIKLSENVIKMTNPGYKKVYRFYSNTSGMALADLIALEGEELDFTRPLTIYHPEQRYKSKTLYDYNVRELLVPLFIDGRQVYDCPSMADIQHYAKAELSTFWEESKRLMNPHVYKVDLSDELYTLKQKLIEELRNARKGE